MVAAIHYYLMVNYRDAQRTLKNQYICIINYIESVDKLKLNKQYP